MAVLLRSVASLFWLHYGWEFYNIHELSFIQFYEVNLYLLLVIDIFYVSRSFN